MKIISPDPQKDQKAHFIVKNRINQTTTYRVVGEIYLSRFKASKWFNLANDFEIITGDLSVYFQIDGYTGEFLLDHVIFGENLSDCYEKKKLCDYGDLGNRFQSKLIESFPNSAYNFSEENFSLEDTASSKNFKIYFRCLDGKRKPKIFAACKIINGVKENWSISIKTDPARLC